MNRALQTVSRLLAGGVAVAAVATVCLVESPAAAQVSPPPVEVIATLAPIYHEGHATYWYNGYWHYRDTHGGWLYYHEEPVYLREWRSHHPFYWHHYR